jgi:hypothetical protein
MGKTYVNLPPGSTVKCRFYWTNGGLFKRFRSALESLNASFPSREIDLVFVLCPALCGNAKVRG